MKTLLLNMSIHRPTYIFITALFIRMVYLLLVVNQIGFDGLMTALPDTINYLKVADDFLNGTNYGENYILIFGPGYASFLAAILFISGKTSILIVLIQVVLSSLSCVLIYNLALRLTDSSKTALIASILAILSGTSISLSVVVLSDTLYFFMFLLGLSLYIKALEKTYWRLFICSGILIGSAILIRSIGQLFPLAMFIFALPFICKKATFGSGIRIHFNKNLTIKVISGICIVLLIQGVWIVRNYKVHDIAILTSAGHGGIGNVAAFALEKIEGRNYREIRDEWHIMYKDQHNLKVLSPKESRNIDTAESKKIIKEHPWEVLGAYFSLTWENLMAVNTLNRILFPELKAEMIKFEYFWRKEPVKHSCFILSMIGLITLLCKRKYKIALILGIVYFYCASTIGFTRWQGSRLFFPGQIAWSILIGYLSATTINFIKLYCFRPKTSPNIDILPNKNENGY